jgi:hypothetical protein
MILNILKIAYQYHYFVLIFLSGGCLSVFPSAGGAVDGVVADIPPEVTI